MNLLTLTERERYLDAFRREYAGIKLARTTIVLCPPAVHLEAFHDLASRKNVRIGSQDCFWEKAGSYTGELSPAMLKSFGADFVIVGHSERRRIFRETSEETNRKLRAAIRSNLAPILCVGETHDERDRGETQNALIRELQAGLAGITVSSIGKIIIAYEPVWAVGTDVIPDSNEVMEVKILIRRFMTGRFGASHAAHVPILYGGSVKQRTVAQVANDPGMDGVLVGRESLQPKEFIGIAKVVDSSE